MAITIIQQPTGIGIKRAYEPMLYKVGVITAGTAEPVVLAILVVDGSPFGEPTQISPQEFTAGQYVFYYDPKILLQDYFNNEQSWGAINTQTNKINPAPNEANTGFSKSCIFTINFIALEQIPPNSYLAPTDNIVSNVLQAYNAKATSASVENTSDYFSLPAQWLHNYSRLNANTQKADAFTDNGGNNFFLTYYTAGNKDESLEIKLYDFNGVLISTNFLDLQQTDNSVNRFRRLGVGVANINNAAPADWKGAAPTQPLITDAVYYYTVRVVYTDNSLNITNIITHPFRFYLINSCPQIQVFNCNEFGFDDVFLFKYRDCEIQYSNENQNYNNPILDFPSPAQRGTTTAIAAGQKTFILRGQFAQSRAKQLSELWASPNIAILLPNETEYIMVVKANDSSMIFKPANGGRIQFEITLIQSVLDNSQRG